MPFRNTVAWLGVPAVVVAAGLAWLFFVVLPDAISPAACDRLQVGMTESQVEAILGKRADHSHHPWDIAVLMRPQPGTDPEWEKVWVGEEWMIAVHLDANERVCKKAVVPRDFDMPKRGFLQSVRRLFGW